jgi:hypothetical protein
MSSLVSLRQMLTTIKFNINEGIEKNFSDLRTHKLRGTEKLNFSAGGLDGKFILIVLKK